ncbi:FMN-dependent NADH-azoreductase [Thalassospira alkalitolerans]|uniref:FMN dependent NADH:quinone oxidoreductase n=1 Tax=Thalassospira alkalitolerans TaxID=1293890 RepID=A0A1Y2LBJ9_9PROT|nr:NAD(P)H-dependent oxidoreductase [Thalassospira alkalitolerans]OSQ48097.1 FMN-dependent NADH-azoreductase [Thalassospira alkalitolerans]|tara:strand:- start:940 stop:1545 length:606 start_codon:yes stop_codon:yes gene_type:complete
MTSILHINASVNGENSNSRQIASKLIERIVAATPAANVVERDLNDKSIPALTGEIVGAFYTPAENRTGAQKDVIAVSDKLVAELKASDVVVIGAPMYNFSVPSTLKAWVDLIARVGVTFNYTENGPKGLLEGKKAYLVVATGGVPVNSAADFATPYLKQVLGFVGIADIEVIDASGFAVNAEEAMTRAIANVAAAPLPKAA